MFIYTILRKTFDLIIRHAYTYTAKFKNDTAELSLKVTIKPHTLCYLMLIYTIRRREFDVIIIHTYTYTAKLKKRYGLIEP